MRRDATDPREERASRTWQRALDARDSQDLRAVLDTPEGRRLVWRLLEEAKVFQLSYRGNADTNFHEGKRALGLWLMGLVQGVQGAEFYGLMAEQHRLAERDRETLEESLRRAKGQTDDPDEDDDIPFA